MRVKRKRNVVRISENHWDDPAWKAMRAKFRRFHPICQVVGCNRKTQHVDHIETVEAAPHRRLDWSNLQGLCHPCHNRLTAAYDRGTVRGACDVEGNPLDPGHPWCQPDNRSMTIAANAKPIVDPRVAAWLKKRAGRAGQRGGGRVAPIGRFPHQRPPAFARGPGKLVLNLKTGLRWSRP